MTDRPSDRAIAWIPAPGGQVTDLITRLDKRLSGPNPVAYHKLTPDEWKELRELIFKRNEETP